MAGGSPGAGTGLQHILEGGVHAGHVCREARVGGARATEIIRIETAIRIARSATTRSAKGVAARGQRPVKDKFPGGVRHLHPVARCPLLCRRDADLQSFLGMAIESRTKRSP